MAADVLNAQGYLDVEPMAPGGGADGGCDIKFLEGDIPGIAFVTLEKKIKEKFKKDLSKQDDAEAVIALFCNVDVTPSSKLAFARDAMTKGYRLLVFDLERLRSLLDSSLKEIRRRYLQIDDAVAEKLRSEVHKLLNYPEAAPDESKPPTRLEKILVNNLPGRLFDLLMQYEEDDIVEVPGIGDALGSHLKGYYGFRKDALQFEKDLMTRIATIVGDRFNSQSVWRMYFDYALGRLFGSTKEEIISWGNSLNYGVTWEGTEQVFATLSTESSVTSQVAHLDSLLAVMAQSIGDLAISEGSE